MANISQTQLSNISTVAGLLVIMLAKFGVFASADEIAFILAAVWSTGWTIYNYIQRFQKGDITLGGIRK